MGARDVDVVVAGGGVVGVATLLALTRRGARTLLVERLPGLALEASGTNSGILHTGFDSTPGELETQMILRAAQLRDPLLAALGVTVLRCGAVMTPRDAGELAAVDALEAGARANGVAVSRSDDGSLLVPGESVTDPVALTLAMAGAAIAGGGTVRVGTALEALSRDGEELVAVVGGERLRCGAVVNAAGLRAGEVAHMAGDGDLDVYPRKGEFLVFDAPAPERILLPVPSPTTKGVLVFASVDGRLICGPTAVDLEDRDDWGVRPDGETELRAKLAERLPELAGVVPLSRYAGLRPAGRGMNYVIAHSRALPGLVHLGAIRSTGLTAAVAIAERACELVGELGVGLGDEGPVEPGPPPPGLGLDGPWWARTAGFVARRAA